VADARARRQRLSVCMIVRNEATDLDRCLRSVRGLADEIVVVDTGSTDSTIDVARAHGARIARAAWHGDFAQARNTSLGMATGDWILVLDADEELEEASRPLVREATERDDADAYWCHLLSFTGDAPDEAHVMENIYPRLFRRAAGLRFAGAVHEQLVVSHSRAPIEPRPSRIRILHYGYLNPVILQKAKISRNTELIEQALRRNPRQPFQWFNLGAEHLRAGLYAQAEAALRRALEIIGDSVPAYLPTLARNLAVALRQQGRHDDALRTVAEFQARYPDYTDLWYLEGTMRADMLDWAGVERAMRRCLELGEPPAHYLSLRGVGTSLPWIWLGVAARETGRPKDAVAYLRRAADLVPEEPMALQQLAALVSVLEGPEAAGQALRGAAARGRHAALAAARALAKAGAFAPALDVLPKGQDGLPDDAYGMLFAGECLFRLTRYAEALDMMLRIPARDPLGLPARLDALLCALAADDRDAARGIMTVIRELAMACGTN
jgi:tetratricopeptide (TPR) repeat protein